MITYQFLIITVKFPSLFSRSGLSSYTPSRYI